MKTYAVNVDVVWSADIRVKANNAADAKRKAWKKFKAKKQNCIISADKI